MTPTFPAWPLYLPSSKGGMSVFTWLSNWPLSSLISDSMEVAVIRDTAIFLEKFRDVEQAPCFEKDEAAEGNGRDCQ